MIQRLTGDRTHFSYRLGDSIEIRVARDDLDERKIDFELPPNRGDQSAKAGKSKKPKKGGKRSAKGQRHQGRKKGR